MYLFECKNKSHTLIASENFIRSCKNKYIISFEIENKNSRRYFFFKLKKERVKLFVV